MSFCPLESVVQHIGIGAPLPFDVYTQDATLLLARGQKLDSTQQLEALCSRGTQVRLADVAAHLDLPSLPPAGPDRSSLMARWAGQLNAVAEVLRRSDAPSFRGALDDACAPVIELIGQDPDLAIFQVLRQGDNAALQAGVRQALRAAIVSHLVAQRLGWSADEAVRALKAALTMNIAMLQLQGELVHHLGPLSAEQRETIVQHPLRGREWLERAGITDALWLRAVAEHHERLDGSGYPTRRTELCALAELLQRADLYTAKLSARAGRAAIPADRAGRELFMSDPSHPMTAALVKEFGVYPPGCFVHLVDGSVGVVVARGPHVTAPLVRVVCDSQGRELIAPERVDTSQTGRAVIGVIDRSALPVRLSDAALDQLAGQAV